MSFTSIAIFIVSGVVFLALFSFFAYLAFRFLPIRKWFKAFKLNMKKKKLLKDEQLLKYCVKRVQANWTETKVREELLLSNRYTIKKIEEVAFIFNIINNEMKGGGKDGANKRQGGIENKTSQAYPE